MLLQALHKLEIHLYLFFLESTNDSNINYNYTMRYLAYSHLFPILINIYKMSMPFSFPHLHKSN